MCYSSHRDLNVEVPINSLCGFELDSRFIEGRIKSQKVTQFDIEGKRHCCFASERAIDACKAEFSVEIVRPLPKNDGSLEPTVM